MKKQLMVVIAFLISIVLTSCQFGSEDLFAKKERCLDYLPVMQEKTDYQSRIGNSPTEPTVFYSPSMDTCIGTLVTTLNQEGNPNYFKIYNLFTNEEIYSEAAYLEQVGMEGWNEYNNKIEELKK